MNISEDKKQIEKHSNFGIVSDLPKNGRLIMVTVFPFP